LGSAVSVAIGNLSTTKGTKVHEEIGMTRRSSWNFVTFAVIALFLFLPGTVHKTLDAVLQLNNLEVYKQSDGFTTQFEVGNDLNMMHGRYGFDRFDLDNHKVFRQQIHAITEFEFDSAVDNRKTNLCCGIDVRPGELILQASRVIALQKARTELGVDFHAAVIIPWLTRWAVNLWIGRVGMDTSGFSGIEIL
jgi:hypothetical protein